MTEASFFFNDTATTEIYTLSLRDALPIYTARAQTGAGVGINRIAHGAVTAATAGSVHKSESRHSGPHTTPHGVVSLTAAPGNRSVTEAGRAQRVSTGHTCLIYSKGLPTHD